MIMKFKGEDARGLKMAQNLILIIESIHAKNYVTVYFVLALKYVCFSPILRCLLYLRNISFFTHNISRARITKNDLDILCDIKQRL